MSQDRVDKLLKAYFASESTPESARAVDQWVREDPANARLLAEFIMLDGLLLVDQKNMDATAILASLLEAEQNAVPLTLDDPLKTSVLEPQFRRPEDQLITLGKLSSLAGYLVWQGVRQPAFVKGVAAAAVLLIGAVLYVSFFSATSPPQSPQSPEIVGNPPAEADRPAPAVASLTDEHDAAWDQQPGQDLFAGQRYTLTTGLAEITTARGAVVILEAPTTIELTDSDNALRLHEGKLFGVCETPTSRGFTVYTAHGQVIDLGTRFGVRVTNSGDNEVRVFEGEVAVKPAHQQGHVRPIRMLAAGQGVSLDDPAMTVRDTSARPMAFVSKKVFELLGSEPGNGSARWLTYSLDMAQHADVVAFFDMTPDRNDPARLVNRSVHGEAFVSDGTVFNGNPVKGRHSRDSALSFVSREHDAYVRIQGNRSLSAITLSAWVRIDRLQKASTSILSSDGLPAPGEFHWQIKRDATLVFTGGIPAQPGEPSQISSSSDQMKGVTDGAWHHLATTVDTQTGVVRFYFDGKPIGSEQTDSRDPINLSSARIGHWDDVDEQPLSFRELEGEMDELILFNRALSGAEVLELYEHGGGPKPPPATDPNSTDDQSANK